MTYAESLARLSIHWAMLASGHPTARLPNLIGFGKRPSAIHEYIVERDRPVTCSTSGLLNILVVTNSSLIARPIPQACEKPQFRRERDQKRECLFHFYPGHLWQLLLPEATTTDALAFRRNLLA